MRRPRATRSPPEGMCGKRLGQAGFRPPQAAAAQQPSNRFLRDGLNRDCRIPLAAVPYSHIWAADLRVNLPGLMKSERQHRQEIVRTGRMIHERGYVAATDGNLSVRLSESRI